MLSFFLCFARRNETSCGVFALFLKRLRDNINCSLFWAMQMLSKDEDFGLF